ncbi:MAG: hypothetical protein J1F23_07610 [Oscillospiraceae bacterium]|nr:hypothetical protein [Oscillospiraceae bacterium]
MKKFTKVISVILIISAMLMATLMPAFAAFPEDAEAYIWVTKEQTGSSPDIYKITMHLEANYPVSVGDIRVYWPTTDFKLIRNTGVANSTVRATNAFNLLGALADDEEYDSEGPDEYAVGPGGANKLPSISPAAKYFNDAVPSSTYSAVQLAWLTGTSDPHLYYDSSIWGNEVAEFYLQKLDGASDNAIDNVNVRADAPLGDAACWTSTTKANTAAAAESWQAAGNSVLFATINFHAPENAIVSHYGDQIRFPGAAAGNYVGKFDIRTLAQITPEDFHETFGATDDEAVAKIATVGFVFERVSTGTNLTVDAVKAYLKDGTALPDTCKDAPVDYISISEKFGGNYVFSCMVEKIPDGEKTDGLRAVAYVKTTDGNVYCYDAVTITNFEPLYSEYAERAGVK